MEYVVGVHAAFYVHGLSS